MPKKGMAERLHIGQGRAGLRRKHEPGCINQPSDVTRRISETSKIATGKTNIPQHTITFHVTEEYIMINHFHQMSYCTWIHFEHLY